MAFLTSIDRDIGSLSSAISKMSFVRIITHYDADGISAGGVLARALFRHGIEFQVSMVRELVGIETDWWTEADIVVFLDMGSAVIDEISSRGHAAVLDHHTCDDKESKAYHINPRLYGIDGSSEACASTLAYLLAESLSQDNRDLIPYAMAGMTGDRQHVDGFTGLNAPIVQRGIEDGSVIEMEGLPLFGKDVCEALRLSNDPYFDGLSGDSEAIKIFLGELGIDPGAKLQDIEKDEALRSVLASRLALRLARQGAAMENVGKMRRRKFWFPDLGVDCDDLTNMINSTGRLCQEGIGLSVVMGDPGSLEEAENLRMEYRQKVQLGLQGLKEKTEALERVQYFINDVPNMGGALAGLGVSYILDPHKAAIAMTESEEKYKISGRATKALVTEGLDLAEALKFASQAVDGVGGGHPIAAGATVPKERKVEFLSKLDQILVGQVGRVPNL